MKNGRSYRDMTDYICVIQKFHVRHEAYCIVMTSGSLEHPLHATPALDPFELMQTIQLSHTTGGGFSNYYPAPAFQQPFIQSYLEIMKGTPREPFSGLRPYSKTCRGYPDVALLANYYHPK